jgi:hypothetical protein
MTKRILLSVILTVAVACMLILGGCNNASEDGSIRDGEYTVEFTRESYDGEDLLTINQREIRVTGSRSGRLEDFSIVIYDENDNIVNYMQTADYGEEIGFTARIRDPEYDAMARWEIYERDQVTELGLNGKIDATPLSSGTK